MADHVCPWWIGWALASPLRKVFYDPARILASYVQEGMSVLEPGPGMGFFTIPLARLVGDQGQVVALDLQQEMLDAVRLRSERKGLGERVRTRLVSLDGLHIGDLKGSIDFVLAFAMVHEVQNQRSFFMELYDALKPSGSILFSEPRWHVRKEDFQRSVETAISTGLKPQEVPAIKTNWTVLLSK
jgi:SAM-dependent methyltransferase